MAITLNDRKKMQWLCDLTKSSKKKKHFECNVGAAVFLDSEENVERFIVWGTNTSVATTLDDKNNIGSHVPMYYFIDVVYQLIHAEVSCLKKIKGEYFRDYTEHTLYTTKAMCLNCATLAVEKGIKRIVMPRPYRINPRTNQPSKWYKTQIEAIELLIENEITIDFVHIDMIDTYPVLREGK